MGINSKNGWRLATTIRVGAITAWTIAANLQERGAQILDVVAMSEISPKSSR